RRQASCFSPRHQWDWPVARSPNRWRLPKPARRFAATSLVVANIRRCCCGWVGRPSTQTHYRRHRGANSLTSSNGWLTANKTSSNPCEGLSSHSVDVGRIHGLGQALGRVPDALVLFTIEVADIGHGIGLTPPVGAAVPEVVGMAVAEINRNWGPA